MRDLYWLSVRFQYVFVRFLYDFGTFLVRFDGEKLMRKFLYVLCTEICTKCVREKRISLHLSSISFNREKKRLFEKKRYGEFIFRIWNDSSQVPTKKSQFYKKYIFLHSEKKIRYLGWVPRFFLAFSLFWENTEISRVISKAEGRLYGRPYKVARFWSKLDGHVN